MQDIPIRAVVRLVGVNENTLRSWERRYQVLAPLRAEDGRRLYNAQDVQKIKYLWALVQNGYSIGSLASYNMIKLKKMYHTQAPFTLVKAQSKKIERYQTQVIRALESFDIQALHQVLHHCRVSLSIKDIVIHLVSPLLWKVGIMILEKKLSIAQEHLLSTCLRDFLGAIYQSLSPYDYLNKKKSKGILLTTREGDFHEFGILLAAILCNLYGFRVYYLGPNTPVAEIAHTCEQWKIHFLLLGFTALPKQRELISAQDFVGQLDKVVSQKIDFCLGGFSYQDQNIKRKIIEIKDFKFLDQFLETNI